MLDPKRKFWITLLNCGLRYNVGPCRFKHSKKNLLLFKESEEDVRVAEDAGVEPPAVSPVSAKRKKAGRRSSGIWRYFSDMPSGTVY